MFTSWFRSLKTQAREQELNLREAQRECLIAERRFASGAYEDLRAAKLAHARGDMITSKMHAASSVRMRHMERNAKKQRMQLRSLMIEVTSISVEPNMKQNILSGVASLLRQANKKIKSKSAMVNQQRVVTKELDNLRSTNRALDEIIEDTLEDGDDVLSDDEEDKETQILMAQMHDEAAMETASQLSNIPTQKPPPRLDPDEQTDSTAVSSSSSTSSSSLKDEEK